MDTIHTAIGGNGRVAGTRSLGKLMLKSDVFSLQQNVIFLGYLLSVVHNTLVQRMVYTTINKVTCFNPLGSTSGL